MHRAHYLLLSIFAVGCRCGAGPDAPVDPECVGCVADGDTCHDSVNCQVGSICNVLDEALYESSAPDHVCWRVECDRDADCVADKTCTLERLCRPTLCQLDADCDTDERCLAGTCADAPDLSQLADCAIVTPIQWVSSGTKVPLEAVALDRDGAVIPNVAFAFRATTDAAIIDGTVATATGADFAGLVASPVGVPGEECSNRGIRSFDPVAPGRVRVILVEPTFGQPISSADVTIAADTTQSLTSDQRGTVEAAVTGTITSITVERAGFSTVTVLRPGGDDLRIPVPRRPDPTRAAGIRGGVDMSKVPSSDVQAAVVYSARPLDLFEYRAFPNVDLVRTKIDAEQLDLHREGDLPGNLVFGLGEEEFTRDSTRCADDEPGLGCFVTRAPAGLTAAWVTGGEYTLSQISDARDGYATETPDRYTPADRARLIQFLSPFLASGWYGARAYLDLDDAPKVPAPPGDADCADPSVARTARCRGDFDGYVQTPMALEHRASITTAVKVPELPPLPGGGCAGTMIVSAYAALTGRGFVLMGIGSADDSSDRTRVDCVVEGARRPFGALSKPLDDGFVALTSAPPHSGLEGADKLLVLATLDVEPGGTRPLDLNLLFVPFERLDSELDLSSRRFLEPAAATVSSSTGIVTSTPPTGATGVRFTATNADGTWIVYAPASMSRIDLPDRPAARAVLADPTFAMLQAFELNDEYASLWNARHPVGFDPEQMRALVTTQCGPDGPCTLE